MVTTVLVVEDEPAMADIIRKALEQIDYVVDTAADGAVALGKADGGRYDLFVLDLMLPVVDGLTVCRKLRERRCLAPILMLTARDAIDDRVHGLETGADDYLPKPFHVGELQARAKARYRYEGGTCSECGRHQGVYSLPPIEALEVPSNPDVIFGTSVWMEHPRGRVTWLLASDAVAAVLQSNSISGLIYTPL